MVDDVLKKKKTKHIDEGQSKGGSSCGSLWSVKAECACTGETVL